jgi:hypothetical protein
MDLHSTQAPVSTQLRIVSRRSAGGIRWHGKEKEEVGYVH